MLYLLKNWFYRLRYPTHMKQMWKLRDKAKKQHKKQPDIKAAMNELLKEEMRK